MDPHAPSPILTAFSDNVAQHGKRDCLQAGAELWTYAEVDERTNTLAAGLHARGIRPGDWVGLWFDPRPEFFLSLLAVWKLRAAAVVYNPKYPEACNRQVVQAVDTAATLIGGDAPAWLPDNQIAIDDLLNTSERLQSTDLPTADETALVQFTSGSTGTNKPVLISHRSLGLNALWTRDALGLTPEDRWFFNMPFASMSGIAHFVTQMVTGSALFPIDQFVFPEQLIQQLHADQITGIGGSPIQARWLVEYVAPGDTRLEKLRRIMTSGDKLPDFLYDQAAQKLPQTKLYCVYGLTELGGRFCVLHPDAAAEKLGSVGRPIGPMQCIVRDPETSDELPSGEVGEIYASGPLLADGYFGMGAATSATFTSYGLRTGDIGRVDADGFVYLAGRKDDVFKSSGEKVSTVAIEQRLLELDTIEDVAAIPVADAYLGQVARVFYVTKPEATFDEPQAIQWIRDGLSEPHVPGTFVRVDAIPRTPTGKVARAELRDRVA